MIKPCRPCGYRWFSKCPSSISRQMAAHDTQHSVEHELLFMYWSLSQLPEALPRNLW